MNRKKSILLLLSVCFVLLFAVHTEAAMSNKYYAATQKGTKVGSQKTFAIVPKKSSGQNGYDLYLTVGGQGVRRILSGIEPQVWTNGVYVYYSRETAMTSSGSFTGTIYRYNVVTGKSKKMIAGSRYTICGAYGDFLYMGHDNSADGIYLYCYNVRTGAKKFMYRRSQGSVQIADSRVLVQTNTGAQGNYPILIFNLSGTNKVKIANGCGAKIKNGYVYYVQWNQSTNKYHLKRCSLTGENKVTVSGWNSKYPTF